LREREKGTGALLHQWVRGSIRGREADSGGFGGVTAGVPALLLARKVLAA
jgi:hypothetical protein